MKQLDIEIMHTSSCPHWQAVRQRIGALAGVEGIAVVVTETIVDDLQDAQARRFPGSPTVLVEGRDIEPQAGEAAAGYGLG
jgi:hypothetical protein